jgi:effector-binding domain-containing protein
MTVLTHKTPEDAMEYACELLDRSTQPTLSIRTRTDVGSLPELMGKSFGSIAQYLGELGEQSLGPPFTAFYNMDMQDLDVEIGFPVSEGIKGSDEISTSEFAGGKYAACLYIGPYSEMEPAYAALSTWIDAQDYQATGIVYEVYLNDPGTTPPEDLQTQILFQLKPTS